MLVVIDDCWDQQHERAINFVDDATGSKVLISSRVRSVLETASTVDIAVPREADAVQMLMAAAAARSQDDGFADMVPPQVTELVRLCNCLPLTIGIIGRLVRDGCILPVRAC